MRQWINLCERVYPDQLSNAELLAWSRLDDDPEYHAGDDGVYFDGRSATLQTISTGDLEHGNDVDADIVDIYAEKTTPAPPIIVSDDLVLDGNHRLAAARARGESTISAYVLDS